MEERGGEEEKIHLQNKWNKWKSTLGHVQLVFEEAEWPGS